MDLLIAGLLAIQGTAAGICAQTSDVFYQKMFDVQNRMAFKNDGGLVNGGVCWWHSRLQRAAWALSVFDPSQPKATPAQAQMIVRTLIEQSSVVLIPGYSDFETFSSENSRLIQRELELWQVRDGFFNQAWIRGISGRSTLPAPQLKKQMDAIYTQYKTAKQNQDVMWLMLQIKGITSHASLLIEMKSAENGGYSLVMVDSNRPRGLVSYEYRVGDTSLTPAAPDDYVGHFTMIPYPGYSNDLSKIHQAVKNFCKN